MRRDSRMRQFLLTELVIQSMLLVESFDTGRVKKWDGTGTSQALFWFIWDYFGLFWIISVFVQLNGIYDHQPLSCFPQPYRPIFFSLSAQKAKPG